MKSPADCRSLEEVRAEIDRLDEQIVTLLGQRLGYVQAVAKFKTTTTDVAAPDRLTSMLSIRRQWATREHLDPDFVERLYRDMVAYFISQEMEHFERSRNDAP